MWNKGFRILWVKLQIDKGKHFGLPFPVPIYIFHELLDCTLDLFTVLVFFIPRLRLSSYSSFSAYTIKALIELTIKLLDSITEDEPYDLVDVTADKVRVFIKIR